MRTAAAVESRAASTAAPVERVEVGVYTIPADAPESDGTLAWDSTTMVAIHLEAGRARGFGYTYAAPTAGALIVDKLADVVRGRDAFDPCGANRALRAACRNLGATGLAAMAISALDVAGWDLKARLLDVSVVRLLGQARDAAPLYGSGGFTSYDDRRLAGQLRGWVDEGIPRVKMKVGRNPADDPRRVRVARDAIGDNVDLFVDANGAYAAQQALGLGRVFHEECAVCWFEEPRPSNDPPALRFVRERLVPGLEVAGGEYAWEARDFRMLLEDGAIDVLQADVTRCGGITGFLEAAALADAFQVPLSAHCAPALHAALGCALPGVRHLEYFHDHVRIEGMLLDGVLPPKAGALQVDPKRPGLGLEFKTADAEQFCIAHRGGLVE